MHSAPDVARHPLIAHPASPPGAVREITATLTRPASETLAISFRLAGDVPQLRLPEPRAPVRADGLWRHTCFEAFIAPPGAKDYWEFNLSPSGAWAAYHFSGYREGMAPLLKGAAPAMRFDTGADFVALDVRLDLSWLARSAGGTGLRVGLAAVVEDRERGLSYWALAHPAEKPDFHSADSFVLPVD